MSPDTGPRQAPRRPSSERGRSSDRGIGGWLKDNWGKIAPFGTILIWVTSVVGFKLTSPRDELAALHLENVRINRRVDSIVLTTATRSSSDSLQRDLIIVKAFTVGLMKDRCLDMTPQRAYNVEMPCDSLLRRYGVRPVARLVP